MKISFLFFNFFIVFVCFSQLMELDSTTLKIYSKFKSELCKNKSNIVLKDTLFYESIIASNKLGSIKGWRKEFADNISNSELIFDSTEHIFFPFIIRLCADSIDKSKYFHFEGFIYKNEVYVNLKRYCLIKSGYNPLLFDTDKAKFAFMEEFAKFYPNKFKPFYFWFNRGVLFQIKVPGFPWHNTYKISLELAELSGYKYLTGKIVEEDEFVRLQGCKCISNYTPIALFKDAGMIIFDGSDKKEIKRKDRLHKYGYHNDSFLSKDYFALSLENMQTVLKGTMSEGTIENLRFVDDLRKKSRSLKKMKKILNNPKKVKKWIKKSDSGEPIIY